MRGCGPGCGAPAIERLWGQRFHDLVAARQIGQEAVDPGPIEPAHDFGDLVAGLVRFVKQGGQDQQAVRARPVEGQGIFLRGTALRQGTGPARDHASASVGFPLGPRESEQRAIGIEQFAIDLVIVDDDAETVLHLRE